MNPESFIKRWKATGSSERGNFQQFLIELTKLIGVDPPNPVTADGEADGYRFERPVRSFARGTIQFIDLYRKGAFVMEAKQGVDGQSDPRQLSLLEDAARHGHGIRGSRRWDDSMVRARGQADRYARDIARIDGWPPFLLVVDVGHVIEVYADFSGQGQGYSQFPDKTRYRIGIEDLAIEEVRSRLKAIWNEPLSLDPSKITAAVTREIAGHLAVLGKSFEGQGHSSEKVARFLMRCLFTMFAEDVDLIPRGSFKDLLRRLRGQPEMAQTVLANLFRAMDRGEPSDSLMTKLMRFNGGLFTDAEALPLDRVQLSLLIAAADCDWTNVEPAIFGTLLERALDARQRHKLGAHYTPRPYVERLVNPVLMEPLRKDWDAAKAAAIVEAQKGNDDAARRILHQFHDKLCSIRVLDPACGSGNFLYVALELMKRLEGEVTALLADLGENQQTLSLAGHSVDPHQFLGIELNPWAAAVAELVLWIGYLQWHYRTHGVASPAEPVLRDFRNIENRDAILQWEERRERRDAIGNPVTRWDGIGTIRHPVTGEEVPDPEARVQVYDYIKPRATNWPDADFIVGNPPFIGKLKFREDLGDGYVEALRKSYPDVPESADLVMYWWHKAALAVRGWVQEKSVGCRRFGLITTRSAKQTFNVRVIQAYIVDEKNPLSIVFAIADHPWVDTVFAAKVRIAMTVVGRGRSPGRLMKVIGENRTGDASDGWRVELAAEIGTIRPNLMLGADILSAGPLKANVGLCSMGFATGSRGFLLTGREAAAVPEGECSLLRTILSTHEITKHRKNRFVIDAWDVQSEDDLRLRFPWVFQRLMDHVYPDRIANNDPKLRREWWRFRRSNKEYRRLKVGLNRFIAAPETSKFRLFTFEPTTADVEHGAWGIGTDDAAVLAILSGNFHDIWSLAQGGDLGSTPRYNKTRCFDPFPFPELSNAQAMRLRSLGEQLDAHRKAQQAAHIGLTLTEMYNVLEKLRAGISIEGRDRQTYQQGLIGILKTLHDDIDAEVAAAYGWPADLSEHELLQRLVDLNRERAEEEARGHVRWLRPEFQNAAGRQAMVKGEQIEADLGHHLPSGKTPWPRLLPHQIAAVQGALEHLGAATPEEIARIFVRGRAASIQPLLESLSIIGRAESTDDGRYHLS